MLDIKSNTTKSNTMVKLQERVRVVGEGWSSWGAVREQAADKQQEEAFYILDIGDIVHKFQNWKSKMPRVDPHYAVKCNDLQIVLEVLAALGAGFDCASKAEINQVLALGVSPDRIIFANPAKPASHLRHASANGIATMTFDSEFELMKIKQNFANAKLVIRIRCDAKVAQCPLGFKFGCDPILEAPQLLKKARMLGLDVVGVSFHVGSGCQEPEVFSRAITHAAQLFEMGSDLGYNMNLLDLGGGFPGGTGTSIDKIAEIVNTSLDEHFPEERGVKIIAEPGRYFVASAFTLACCVHAKRVIYDQDTDTVKHAMYFVNDGVYGSFNCILYDHQEVTAIPLKGNTGNVTASSVWGPTCDSMDQILADVSLPQLEIGDWLVFRDMGAYTLPVASPFNGFPVPQVTSFITRDLWNTLKDISPLNEQTFIGGIEGASADCGHLHSCPMVPPCIPVALI